jgi:hypothetical protein
VKNTASLTSLGTGPPVLAFSFPSGCFPGGRGHAGAVDRAVEHVRQRLRRQRHQLPAGDQGGSLADCGGLRRTAGLGRALDPLDGQLHPGQVFQQPGRLRERSGGRGDVVHRGQARGQGRAGHAELGIARREAVLAFRAAIPGTAQRDRAEDRIKRLVPVVSELRLMPLAAQHPRAALAGVGGQQLPQHAAAGLQQPGAQRSLGGPEPAVAAQRPGRFGGQPCYLGGPGFRERGEEPPFSPSGTGGACVRAAGRASQIRSFTSAICSTAAVNSAYRAISRRTFSTSAAAS